MRSRPLSASSMKTFLQCVLKYYYQYEDKKPRKGRSVPLAFGSAVHKALEEMHTIVSEKGEKPSEEDYDRVLKVFMQAAVDYGLSDTAAIAEGRNTIISRLDTVNPNDKIIGLELGFELETPAGTPFLGSIDKLVELDEETVAVIDYKTSRMALTQEEADNDIQLSMYDLAVSMMFPQYKTIVCALDYTRLTEVITHRTPEQRAQFVELVDTVYQTILRTEVEDVEPSINDYCGWCDFKNFCPSYSKLVTDPALVLPILDELDEEGLVDAYEEFNAARRVFNSRYGDFKNAIHGRLMENDVIAGKESEIYKIQGGRKDYHSRKIFNIVGPEAYANMSSITKSSLEKYMRDNPEKAEEIERFSTYTYNSPQFKTRKKKDK